MSPCGLHFGCGLGRGFVKAREQFCGHVRTLFDGQLEGFSKKLLRSGRHMTILDATGQPNKRLHQTAAWTLRSRW